MVGGTRRGGARALVGLVLGAAAVALGGRAVRADDGGAAWDPARTWVVCVGVLRWNDPGMTTFPQEDRRDAELVALLRERGVPANRITYLQDEKATAAAVRAALDRAAVATRPGDLLVVYYTGHGARGEDGRTAFQPFDAAKAPETQWSVQEVFDAIEAKAKADRALLIADCCYSGDLVVEARRRPAGRVAWSCLASSQASEPSTGRWTYTEQLLAALRGEPAFDADGDGQVELSELARAAEAEMAFAEQQLTDFLRAPAFPDLTLAPARGPRAGNGPERVEALWKGTWYRATVLERDGQRARVRYAGFGAEWDEWVGPDRLRPHAPVRHPAGAKVEVRWKKSWYAATVLEERQGIHRIHYDGWSDVWDEWVPGDRIRPRGGAAEGAPGGGRRPGRDRR